MKQGLVLGCVICVLTSLVATSLDVGLTDFFQFWAAARIVTIGGDPYDAATWAAIHMANGAKVMDPQFIYPLPLAILFAPLGLLNPTSAYLLWMQLSACMVAIAVLLCTLVDRRWIVPLLVCIYFFRPLLTNLLMGHLGGLLLLAVTVAVHCWQRDRWWGGGLALSLLAVKPGIGLPIIVLVALWLVVHVPGHNPRLGALGAICIGCVGLLLAGLAYDLAWVGGFIANITAKSPYYGQPSLAGLGWLGGMLAVGLLFLFYVVASRTRDPGVVVGLAVAVAMAAAPYTWTYDHVLLLAPILALLARWPAQRVVIALLAVDLFAAGLTVASASFQSELVNLASPMLVCAAISVERISARKSERDSMEGWEVRCS